MEDLEHERQHVVDYLASEAPDETVEHLEKVKTERVLGRSIEVWDVHTDQEHWWVITAPTNLYSQRQFPSLEVALSVHVGLTARVMERERRTARPEQAARFAKAWRAWEQAGEALADADEAEAFQAIGMRCRESLLAFIHDSAALVRVEAGSIPPKKSDFVGWSELLGNTIAAGGSADRRRGYLKAVAKSTWELVNWLTHAERATPYDAHFAHAATEHVLSSWSLALMRFELGIPDQCPKCMSYQLATYTRPLGHEELEHFTVCRACAWRSEPHVGGSTEDAPSPQDCGEEDPGPCVFVDVPLKGPAPPRPTRSRPRP